MASWAIAVHGGAYNRHREGPEKAQKHFLHALLAQQTAALQTGAVALKVVIAAVVAMEDSGLFNAGRGSVANAQGIVELDAGLMDGATARAGAVAAIRGFRSPILCAHAVMEHTPHVLLTGPGAEEFLRRQKLEQTPPAYFLHEHPHPNSPHPASAAGGDTIGVVACDREGNLAVATSTGGIAGKPPGRVGDSPIIGAGTYADRRIAISCTGTGEYFIRTATAARIAARMEHTDISLRTAAQDALDQVGALGGSGGLIAVSREGQIVCPFNSKGMVHGWATPDGFDVRT